MKILLNLLPVEKKIEMRRQTRFRMIVAHGSVIIFLGFFYCCSLLGISALLSSQLSSMQGLLSSDGASAVSGQREIESYEQSFQDTNKRVSEISRLLAGHISWKPLFRALDTATPSGVLYSKIAVGNDLFFSASGTAPSREALLALENSVNDSDCFSDASVPLSDKLVKENIDFQLSATVLKSCLVSGEDNQ
ncbi:MAG: hypothetical protein IPK84_01550 [Candidatus Moraniibacteriota bacterium]|nr:MAG: hypothetical protein IPK84_01550 [Candidatus Moranbacteria bacterium]